MGSGHYGNVTLQAQWEHAEGDLKIQKTVAGNGYIAGQKFPFTVTITDASNTLISGTFGGVTFDANGQCTFNLSGGSTKTIAGLPAGAKYTVAESDNQGYTVSSENATGTITGGATVTATFTNTKNLPIDTGISLDSLPYIIILLAAIAVGVAWVIIKKRRHLND